MHEIMSLFKKGVPRQKKVYQAYINEVKLQNYSYEKFKKENIVLVELMEYLTQLDEYYYLSNTQIDNIFEYLNDNLYVDKFSRVKKVFNQLHYLSDFLNDRYRATNSLHGVSIERCLYIINKIEELKDELSKDIGLSVLDIEHKIQFEIVVNDLLNPKEYSFDEEKLVFLLDNIRVLGYTDRNDNGFNNAFCKQVTRAKAGREKEKLKYYRSIYTYLSTLKYINLDDDYLKFMLDIKNFPIDDKLIDKKIASLRINPHTGKKTIDDYILSIDNVNTKKIDDAFSIEKIEDAYLVGIHIADVYSLGYFEEDSLDVNKKNSVNKKMASLNRNKERDAITVYFLIDNNGIIRDYRMLNTTIITDINLVYSDIPKILRDPDVNPDLRNTVINLLSVYNLLDNDKFPNNPTVQNLGIVMVGKLMVLCSALYSEEFSKRDVPAIYLGGNKAKNYYSIEKPRYETGFKNFDNYAKVTSPIIDRLSLINQFFIHQGIFHSINEEDKPVLIHKLVPIVDKLNKMKKEEEEKKKQG